MMTEKEAYEIGKQYYLSHSHSFPEEAKVLQGRKYAAFSRGYHEAAKKKTMQKLILTGK